MRQWSRKSKFQKATEVRGLYQPQKCFCTIEQGNLENMFSENKIEGLVALKAKLEFPEGWGGDLGQKTLLLELSFNSY